MTCRFWQNKKCELLTYYGDRNGWYIYDGFCEAECSPNQDKKKKKMLSNFGINLPEVPLALDWAQQSGDAIYNQVAKKRIEDSKRQQKVKESQRKEITHAVAQLPTKYQMVRNLGKHAITVAKHYKDTGRVMVTEEHRQAREDVCMACDKHKIDDNGSLRCTLKSCGCHLKGDLGRLAFEALPCDAGKHKDVDALHTPKTT